MDFTWLEQERRLAPPALTVRAQTVSPNDTGILHYDTYFPRADVESIDLTEIITTNDRPVADRRDWDGPGRLIPIQLPGLRGLEMTPIEAYDLIGEKEIQRLSERAIGNQQIIRDIVGSSVPARSDRLASSTYRRLEFDAFEAWLKGYVTVRNPQDATKAFRSDLKYAANRLQTAQTPWNTAGVNAYDEFMAWLLEAIDAVGGIDGVVLRLALLNKILADAPQIAGIVPGAGGDVIIGSTPMQRDQLARLIEQKISMPFRFDVIEDSHDVFDDGGTARTRTKVFSAGYLAAIPAGGTAGSTYFAPVARAMEMAQIAQEAGIDIRGVSVFYDSANLGKQLRIEAQLNALTVPNEQQLFVINTGVGV